LPCVETMGKDLRTTAVQLRLHRYSKLDASAWGLQNPQPFFPPLEKLFKTETVASLSEYGVKLSEEIEKIVDTDTIRTSKGKVVNVHQKTTMILSPFKWMRGDYGSFGLPKPEEIAKDIQEKLQSPHTAGYVGALSSIALSESGCVHFPKVYGVYVGLAKDHTIDISDDYEDLSERRWFNDNLGKTFELNLRTPTTNGPEFSHTRGQRPNVVLGDETLLDEIEDVDVDHISNPSTRSHSMSHTSGTDSTFLNDDSSDKSDDDFEILSCDCDDDEEEDDEDEDEEPFAWATFHNVPVITTVMEKCEGTYYELIEMCPEPEKHAAWVCQIVFALAYAQRNYGFAHNDLHGNNVMYVKTDQEYLFYKHNGAFYKVPTYGYIMKIIDFDRATLSMRLIGMKEPRHFVSSQFQKDDEAAGQYNLEPFLVSSHPHIAPSSSFDLCRFATSVFWDMFPDGPDQTSDHPLFAVFLQWMTQADGTSVLFRRNKSDNHDRYHGFHLYKAIARYCKDAVPRREIAKLVVYKVPSVPLGTPCLFIEN
jgi:hypothetical protein